MREKIAVLMGGRSLEREVSLSSGRQVCAALEAAGYYVLALDVTADLVGTLRSERPNAAYIALHGKYGEDGTIQELLEFLRISYTGPGVVASALSWDKSVTKHLLAENGVSTPAWVTLTADAFKEMGAATAIDLMGEAVGGFPVAVKPSRQGSALGMRKVQSAGQLAEALLDALSYDTAAIVERWIDGTELAITVLGTGDEVEVLPAVEIVPTGALYDFDARMAADGADFFVPARVSADVAARAASIAARVHQLIGCRDVSRVDMVIDSAGVPQVLECNTSPGMTETSLLPMAAKAAGMTFQDVVSKVIAAALARS
ncbi:MAG: D-alanine--D-alanine ligase [Actinobacteria bacterium HGW-Actinobacteria-7]|nr:MAG: D-alanine--D-alanine ligase [Actinobacteria bacterium HGW-Actinobacteria-7]